MKKYLKILSSIVVLVIPVAIIAYTAVPRLNMPIVSLTGSSSLQPLMTKFSDTYTASDLVVQGGGSGYGIKSVATGITDIGLASKNPYSSILSSTKENNDYDKTDWTNKHLKTFTIAFDNIGIIYKTKDKSHSLNINKDNILKLYEMFSGVKSYKISDLISDSSDTNSFIPYARTGGENASGTASTFSGQFQGFSWSSQPSEETTKIKSILKSGDYLGDVRSTNESNVETWNKLRNENLDGAITYLSLSFVLENYKTITDAGFSLATVNNINAYNSYTGKGNKLDSDFIKTYGWFSIYNIMVSQDISDNVKNFIKWIYFNQDAQNIINDLALVSVGSNQTYLKSMLSSSYKDTTINESNFISIFFNYANSDASLINNEWTSGKTFGIPNSTIIGSTLATTSLRTTTKKYDIWKLLKEIDFENKMVKL